MVFPLRDINPASRTPIVTYVLIALNVVVFLFQWSLGPELGQRFVLAWGMTPRFLLSFQPEAFATLFTSMFLHGGWMHIISNMWSLWIFGDNVEDRLGRVRFVLFYLGCGVAAALAQTLTGPNSVIPMVGASGAIAGVMAAYLKLFPHARLVTLIIVVVFAFVRELPAVFFIVFWFVLQLLFGLGTLGQVNVGGVAFFAHIGGFLAGLYLLGRLLRPRNPTGGFRPPSSLHR